MYSVRILTSVLNCDSFVYSVLASKWHFGFHSADSNPYSNLGSTANCYIALFRVLKWFCIICRLLRARMDNFLSVGGGKWQHTREWTDCKAKLYR